MSGRPPETWWAQRLRRLTEAIEEGTYDVPAEEVAAAILYGRPKWGEDPLLVGEREKG